MSLRIRLTLLYSLLMGGVLLIFGGAAYMLVNNVLVSRVDDVLADVKKEFVALGIVDQLEEVSFIAAPVKMDVDISVQVWGLDNKLQDSFGPLGQSSIAFYPLNRSAKQEAGFHETHLNNLHLRVLIVPISHNNKRVAVMQVATAWRLLHPRAYLLSVLAVIWVYGVIIAGILSWFTLGQALEPLRAS